MKSIASIADYLIEHRAPGLPLGALSELFDRMIWTLEDNGAELLSLRAAWLKGNDPVRGEVALRMTETYPVQRESDYDELEAAVSAKWPALLALVHASRRSWHEQFGAAPPR